MARYTRIIYDDRTTLLFFKIKMMQKDCNVGTIMQMVPRYHQITHDFGLCLCNGLDCVFLNSSPTIEPTRSLVPLLDDSFKCKNHGQALYQYTQNPQNLFIYKYLFEQECPFYLSLSLLYLFIS